MNANKHQIHMKEDKNMIHTGAYKLYGQLEEQAQEGDIEAFVFRNGQVIPASQAQASQTPVIHTAPEKNYGLMEDLAKGNAEIEEFVLCDGKVVPVSQTQGLPGPVIHTSEDPNFAI